MNLQWEIFSCPTFSCFEFCQQENVGQENMQCGTNEDHGEIQRDDRLRGFDDALFLVDILDSVRALVDGGAPLRRFGGYLPGVFGRVSSDAGTFVLLSRVPDGGLFTLREHLRRLCRWSGTLSIHP